MGQRYDSIKQFEGHLRDWSCGLLLGERILFEEMAELMLEPLDIIAPSWQDKEKKAAQLMILARLFNDFEGTKIILLNGLAEQAFMPLRDTIECMGLLRLFEAEPKRALRWVSNLAAYKPGSVKAELRQVDIEAPQSAHYDAPSQLAHPNFVASVTRVNEIRAGEMLILRQYHFGGYQNDRLLIIQFHLLLCLQIVALMEVLPRVYYPYLTASPIADWFIRVQGMVPKLQAIKVPLEVLDTENPKTPETPQERALRQLMEIRFNIKFDLSVSDIDNRE